MYVRYLKKEKKIQRERGREWEGEKEQHTAT